MKTILIAAALAAAGAAQAHVTLEQSQAPAASSLRAVFRVGHACQHGDATQAITVRVPAGFADAKPMPKAGWTLTIKRADTGGDAVEIRWQAASRDNWLPEDQYDEFVLRGRTPAQPGALWFKVLQQCEKGQADWAEVPAAGTATRGLKTPALLLEVTPSTRPAAASH